MKTLRPYQEAANKALFRYLFDNPGKHPLVVAPVAAGKSLMIAEFIRQLHEIYPRTRIVMLTHVKELLIQNSEELDIQYFGCDMGFYCAGLKQKRLHNDVTFASIQSIHNKIGEFNRAPEIIIVDECHLISHKTATRYRAFIKAVLDINPNCRVIGFTGTPFRADTGRLDKGEGKLFDDVAYDIGIDYMIEQGYWAKPVCPALATKMDVSGVSVRGGDYVASELEKAVNTSEMNDACVTELLAKGVDRKKWLVFTAGIQHAADVMADIESRGIAAEFLTGETASAERALIINRFRKGEIRCLVNVAVLTTGFNVPDIDLLAFMRPTRSPVLYVQTVGRGVRPVYAPGFDLSSQQGRLDAIAASVKPDCMILDFGGVVASLGPIDEVAIKKEYTEKEKAEREALYKLCPLDKRDRQGNLGCGAICAPAQRYCYECSYCFIDLNDKSAEKAIVSRDVAPEWRDVLDIAYNYNFPKEGKQPTLKVSYYTMAGVVREWICFEHHVYDPEDNRRHGWNSAVKWHNERLPDVQCPNKIQDAQALKYPKPSRILVRKKGQYHEVIDFEWDKAEEIVIAEIENKNYFEIPF